MRLTAFAMINIYASGIGAAPTTTSSSLRGFPTEDIEFWERQLGGSNRRQLTIDSENSIQFHDEDMGFWERQLGGSNRRALAIQEQEENNEEIDFWGRELGSSNRL